MEAAPPQRLLQTPSWLLTQVAANAARLSRDAFAAVGAGRYHFAILCAAAEFGPCSQADIGARLHMDRKDVAQRVGELEREGAVARQSDPTDPRRKLVTLTPAGEQRLSQIEERLSAAQAELLAPLTPQERAQLQRALGKLLPR